MKKSWLVLSLVLLFSLSGFAQTPDFQRSYTVTDTTVTTGVAVLGQGFNYYRVCWAVEGAGPTATIVLQKSNNNSTWSTLVSSGSVTTNACSAITADVTNYVRINPSSFSGGGAYSVVISAWTKNPNPGGTITTIDTVTTVTAVTAITNALPTGTNTIGSVKQTDGTTVVLTDPCQGVVKTSTPIAISTATTTRIVAPTAAKKTYICSIVLFSAGTQNIGVIEGTGGTCGTATAGVIGGTTAASGFNFTAQTGLAWGSGVASLFNTAGTNVDLCLISSAAVVVAGAITWVQQ